MKILHRFFLILLRIAIGWHLLFEGLAKIESVYFIGTTETNKPWTSAPYLREATGPFGDFFRRQVGDPDDEALARLTVLPVPPGPNPARQVPHTRFPPALGAVWQSYFDHFIHYYQLDDQGGEDAATRAQQRALAEAKLRQCQDNTVTWLISGTKRVKKSLPFGTVEMEETTPERIAAYRAKVQELRDKQTRDLAAFGSDVYKDKLRSLRGEVNKLRNDLVKDLDEQTAEMKKALLDVLNDADKAKGRMTEPAPPRPAELIDNVTMFGLTVVGACLILGLFTRTACLGGAAFLLLFYLSMPAFPWVPENIRAEGHYFFVNKNLIELLALLALATTRTGIWVGLDGLVQFLNPWRWRGRAPSRTGADLSGSRAFPD
jgi:uncharacterized membrane protein YphA (DoxX/SURF4 family)